MPMAKDVDPLTEKGYGNGLMAIVTKRGGDVKEYGATVWKEWEVEQYDAQG